MKLLFLFPLVFSNVFLRAQMQWEPLGHGLNGQVSVMKEHDGFLYAAGGFTDAGSDPDADYLARWDGMEWHAVAPGITDYVYAFGFTDNGIVIGGYFHDVGGNPDADYVALWDGMNWHAFTPTLNSIVQSLDVANGIIYVGGDFTNAGGDPNADHIAAWDGENWNALGTGLNTQVFSIVCHNNNVYAGGPFLNAGGNPNADCIAYWNGATWNPIGNGLHNQVMDIKIYDDVIYVSGMLIYGDIATWNGNEWVYFPDLALNDWVNHFTVVGETIYAAAWSDGVFAFNGNYWIQILEADPTGQWLEIVTDVIVKDGVLHAGGYFDAGSEFIHNIAKWVPEPLAIALHSLNAEYDKPANRITISWRTTEESYTDFFMLDRSIQGQPFTAIARIDPVGNCDLNLPYVIADPDPPQPGTIYYRLREIDFDGNEMNSSITYVQVPENQNVFNVYPSPCTDQITLSLPDRISDLVKVSISTISDVQDKIIYHTTSKDITLDVSTYPRGVYFIVADWDGRHAVKKFVKY